MATPKNLTTKVDNEIRGLVSKETVVLSLVEWKRLFAFISRVDTVIWPP